MTERSGTDLAALARFREWWTQVGLLALFQEIAEAAEQVLRDTQDYEKRILHAALTAGGGVVAVLGLLVYALWGPPIGKEWAALLAFCLFSALTLIVAGLLGVIVQLSRRRLMRRLVNAGAPGTRSRT